MLKETNLQAIRNTAVDFLWLDIQETGVGFVATHPFTNSWVVWVKRGESNIPLDLHEKDDLRTWRKDMEILIQKADLPFIFLLLHKAYYLSFIKYIKSNLSAKDLGFLLANYWTSVEQISNDCNVTGREMVKFFKQADKEYLMEEEQRAGLAKLPNTVTVYRGVTEINRNYKKALSWTLDRERAIWFAERFDTGTGEVWEMEVPKESILCYFMDRGEDEVVIDTYSLKDIEVKRVKL